MLHALKVERMNSSMKPVTGFWSFVEHLRSRLLETLHVQKDSRIKQYTGALLLADRRGFSEEEGAIQTTGPLASLSHFRITYLLNGRLPRTPLLANWHYQRKRVDYWFFFSALRICDWLEY